jgi:hypothetical protein
MLMHVPNKSGKNQDNVRKVHSGVYSRRVYTRDQHLTVPSTSANQCNEHHVSYQHSIHNPQRRLRLWQCGGRCKGWLVVHSPDSWNPCADAFYCGYATIYNDSVPSSVCKRPRPTASPKTSSQLCHRTALPCSHNGHDTHMARLGLAGATPRAVGCCRLRCC